MKVSIEILEQQLKQHIARTRIPCATRIHVANALGMKPHEWQQCIDTGEVPYEKIIAFALDEYINLNQIFIKAKETE